MKFPTRPLSGRAMTVRELVAALQPFTVGAVDGDECSIRYVEDDAIYIDMGSDIQPIYTIVNAAFSGPPTGKRCSDEKHKGCAYLIRRDGTCACCGFHVAP